MMRVAQLMTPSVKSCRPDDALECAARLMWEADCGCIPVCDGDARVIGVITDRDICMSALFSGLPLHELSVSHVIREQQLRACGEDDPLEHAEYLMRLGRVRRLPVVDSRGALVGMISLADLSREASRQDPLSDPDKEITHAEVNETLMAICSPAQFRSAQSDSFTPR